jgi:hypothetical protein
MPCLGGKIDLTEFKLLGLLWGRVPYWTLKKVFDFEEGRYVFEVESGLNDANLD